MARWTIVENRCKSSIATTSAKRVFQTLGTRKHFTSVQFSAFKRLLVDKNQGNLKLEIKGHCKSSGVERRTFRKVPVYNGASNLATQTLK